MVSSFAIMTKRCKKCTQEFRKKREARQREVYLRAWSPKGGGGVNGKAKVRDKERLIVGDETNGFYRGTHKK